MTFMRETVLTHRQEFTQLHETWTIRGTIRLILLHHQSTQTHKHILSKSSLIMAYRINFSPLALLFIFNILFAITGQAVAGREIPKNVDVKQPEWLIKSDHSFLIPGIGRVMVPPLLGGLPFAPYTGSNGGSGSGSGGSGSGSGYIPGGDDTFVPNPGAEVPNPAGRGVPAPANP